jgi:MFS family permease
VVGEPLPHLDAPRIVFSRQINVHMRLIETGSILAGNMPRTAPRLRATRALGHRSFRVIWATFLIGQLGFWLTFVSFQSLMADLTDSDGTWLGLIYFTNFIPMLLFAPVAGVVADRVERKRILTIGYLAISAIVSGLAAITLADAVTQLWMLPFAFLLGTGFAFTAPASQSIIANTVPIGDLPSAVAMNSVGANLARVVGPTVAAPVIAIWNEGVAFAAYGVAALVVAVRLRSLPIPPNVPEAIAESFLQRLRGGLAHARERPPAVAALALLCVSSVFAGSYLALLPIVAKETFGRPDDFTTLAAVTGLGSVLGGFSSGLRQTAPTFRAAAGLVAAFGISLMVFGLSTTWTVALITVALVGACYFAAMTTLNTLLQSLCDDAKRGRMMSLFLIGWAGLVPIGGLWQGLSASAFGPRPTVLVAGAVTAAFPVVAVTLRRRRRPVYAV